MNDLDKLFYVLDILDIKHYDYYRPSGKADVQICDHDSNVIAIVEFDADGNFQSYDICDD